MFIAPNRYLSFKCSMEEKQDLRFPFSSYFYFSTVINSRKLNYVHCKIQDYIASLDISQTAGFIHEFEAGTVETSKLNLGVQLTGILIHNSPKPIACDACIGCIEFACVE